MNPTQKEEKITMEKVLEENKFLRERNAKLKERITELKDKLSMYFCSCCFVDLHHENDYCVPHDTTLCKKCDGYICDDCGVYCEPCDIEVCEGCITFCDKCELNICKLCPNHQCS